MTGDQVTVTLIAAGWSLAVGVVGALVGWRIRRASIRWSAGLIALVAVGGVVAGVVGTARAMFLSPHDLGVVALVCAVSGVVSAGFALLLARTLTRSARRLRLMAATVGAGDHVRPPRNDSAEIRAVAEELTRSSERLRTSQARERQLEQSRRELVAWVSHDLRTPLAGLRAMAEALDDGMATDPQRYHRQMLKETDRMAAMVDDLFELSRIHAGALNLTLQPMALRDVVSETIAGATPVARSHGVEVGGRVLPDVEVTADAAALSRVVGNLVMNAIRHTPADGVVLVEGRTTGDAVELTVTDGCGGINPDDLASVFEVGWRGTPARTPGPDTGAGLGLAIVRGLVEAHQGTVAVTNHGNGCRFVVRLPA
ncbi:HAMP domain-containing sensor histidine kinase [Pedococcus bigeumensis]|uniref:Sensor-like histidine kinase SenX3 n=1 Tax=Pedococcus bigeumensis TaxID=433644 RepID=A0A502D213_9MICO|nr:HAMP domain-containing sensor histidine kinase [Pedococcus bigeumensis]TPG18429.1 sensor histidine kinase [Pedococcus bigeumensis]